MTMRSGAALAAMFLCACDPVTTAEWTAEWIDEEPAGEGVAFDAENPNADLELGKADLPKTYQVPEDLPDLQRPEIIVSLKTKTVHLFDRATGFSAVYPTGPGQLGADGTSITPSGFYQTHSNTEDSWYFIGRRYAPSYFGGFPFLRLDILNSDGAHTYGFHGPITYSCEGGGSGCDLEDRTWFLVHDYVSHGCMRMEVDDIVELFWSVREIPSVPVAIVDGFERDAAGDIVDLGTDPVLPAPGAAIDYAECGARPDPWETPGRWSSRHC